MTERPSPLARETSRQIPNMAMQDRRSSFLLALGDRLRNIVDARAITDATAEALGQHMARHPRRLRGDRRIQPDTQTSGPTGPTARSRASSAVITSIASARRWCRAGATASSGAWMTSRRTRAPTCAPASTPIAPSAFAAPMWPPLIRGGRLVAAIAVQSADAPPLDRR